MTTLIDDSRASGAAASPTQYFYFNMALACMATAFLGFAPTYWLPLAHGSFSASPLVHFHGLLFFAWTLYFTFQTWLAASGQTARHRTLGMIGVSLATAMTIFGFLAAVNVMKRSAAMGMAESCRVSNSRTATDGRRRIRLTLCCHSRTLCWYGN